MTLSVLDAACWYAGMRLHSFPVEPRGKAPIGELVPNGKDDATVDLPTLDRWFRGANGRTPNIGIACGPSDLVVIDIDPRNGGEATFSVLERDLGPLPSTWTADTGGGGVHMPFRAPAGAVLVGKLGPGVDLIRNGYIVAPPSVHPSGGIYSWRTGHGPGDVALAQLPAPWIACATRRPAEPAKTSKAPRRDDERTIKRARKYLDRMEPAIQGQNGSGALFAAVCRMMHGFDLDDGAVRSLIVEDYNPRCDPSWSDREIDHKIREAREKVDADRWRIEDRDPKPANMSPEQRSDAPIGDDEQFQLEPAGKRMGLPICNQKNIALALRKLGVIVRYDIFGDREIVTGLDGYGPDLDDAAMVRLHLLVDERFMFRPAKDFFYDVVGVFARQNSFHPVRDYLEALRWDRSKRIDRWLTTYAGAADGEFIRAISRIVLVAAVRRVRQPGCKYDEMLVLESEQGTSKSSALAALAGPDDWFTDDLPLSADTKRQMETMAGKWIIEAGELKGMSKGDVAALKSFLSRRVDEARMAYGRKKKVMPRQCVIIGTTNETQGYLKDSTGNRRFWPVRIKAFDAAAIRRDRDQLWAEAVQAEAAGESIRLDPKFYADAAVEQDARRVDDPFEMMLDQALGDLTGKIKISDCYQIVGIEPGDANQDQMTRLGSAMRGLGWDRKQRRFGGVQDYAYVRGDKAEQETVLTVSGKGANAAVTPCHPRHPGVA